MVFISIYWNPVVFILYLSIQRGLIRKGASDLSSYIDFNSNGNSLLTEKKSDQVTVIHVKSSTALK